MPKRGTSARSALLRAYLYICKYGCNLFLFVSRCKSISYKKFAFFLIFFFMGHFLLILDINILILVKYLPCFDSILL